MSSSFDRLARFLREEMRMSHIYQPLMIKTLLLSGGAASTRAIAAAFLAEDESQLEYYEAITKRMPGKVLRARGIVERQRMDIALLRTLARSHLMMSNLSLPCATRPSLASKPPGARQFGSIAPSDWATFQGGSATRL